eukprot:15454968-Alexandrium_andersonii.AAC.1
MSRCPGVQMSRCPPQASRVTAKWMSSHSPCTQSVEVSFLSSQDKLGGRSEVSPEEPEATLKFTSVHSEPRTRFSA